MACMHLARALACKCWPRPHRCLPAQRIIDLTLGISADSLAWGSTAGLGPNFRTLRGQRSKGDVANMSWLRMDAHTATHLDAPSHFVQVGAAPWLWCYQPASCMWCGCV